MIPPAVMVKESAIISLVLDQWTKVQARTHLRPRGPFRAKVVIDNLFDLRYAENPGVAFSMLQDIPGVGGLFGNTTRTRIKRELVILLKPTVIKGEKDWEEGIEQANERMQNFGSGARLSPLERP